MKKSKQHDEFFSHVPQTMKIGFVIITAVMYALLTLSSCRNSEKKHEREEYNNPQQEGEENHNQDHSRHSQRMNDTREWLKQELGEKYNQPVSLGTEERLVQGKDIFTKNCVSCHGSEGKGDGPGAAALQPKPADFTDPEHSSFYSNQGRIHLIKKGIKGTAMAGWENTLSEEEILSVYAYVNSLKNSGEMMEHHEQNH
jgi:mono/diheme cytochrome c family protein